MALVKTTSTGKPVELNGLVEESFSLDLSSTDTLISLLANMYARPEFSSLRELLQNAKDAGPGHIDVTLPTEAEPTLIVRDFGKGMSESDMRDLIQKVGASDKRGDATQAGNLGIGSIAPMSIADTMTISSFKNGKMTVLTAWKNDAGDIRLSITPSVESSEPRGTKVCVPLHPELFGKLRAGLEVFRFSPEFAKRIRVDGDPLVPFAVSFSETVKVGEHEVKFSLVDGETEVLPGALVLMNEIPMGASLERFPELKDFADFLESHEAALGRRIQYVRGATTMVIDIPPAAGLSFPPSREVVAVTRLNAAFLSNACQRYFALGVGKLEEQGLHLGCESAVLAFWRSKALEAKQTQQQAQAAVTDALNRMSKYLRATLGFAYWGGKGTPVVTIEPKLPNDCAPRALSASHFYMKRSSEKRWRLQTNELVPLDTMHPELGLKYPFAGTSSVRLIHWDADLGAGGWSSVLAQNRKAKQALFELATVPDRYAGFSSRNALVLSKPLPDDHPLATAPNAESVDFGKFLETFEPREDNPYAAEEDEEDEDTKDGVSPRSGPKRRHPRTFLSVAGEREQLGLPLEKPFPYLQTLRDRFTADNCAGLPTPVSGWDAVERSYQSWLRMFENAGIGEGYDVVYLIPSEIKNIKRPHRPLREALAEDMEAYLDGLDADERDWLPFALFRGMLKHKCPSILAYFDGLAKGFADSGNPVPDPALETFLKICAPAPSDRTAVFAAAWKKEPKDASNAVDQFDVCLDLDPPADSSTKLAALGFPAAELAKPAKALKEWLGTGTPLATFTRLYWSVCHEKGQTSRIGRCAWVNPSPGRTDKLVTPETAADIAKLLDPRL